MQGLVAKAGLLDEVELDSAGTAGWHVGNRADPRARQVARSRGLQLTSRARRFEPGDFDRFDYILAMDRSNLRDLRRLARTDAERDRVSLLRDFDSAIPAGAEVPDPYYGGEDGFEDVFDICQAACTGLLDALRQHLP